MYWSLNWSHLKLCFIHDHGRFLISNMRAIVLIYILHICWWYAGKRIRYIFLMDEYAFLCSTVSHISTFQRNESCIAMCQAILDNINKVNLSGWLLNCGNCCHNFYLNKTLLLLPIITGHYHHQVQNAVQSYKYLILLEDGISVRLMRKILSDDILRQMEKILLTHNQSGSRWWTFFGDDEKQLTFPEKLFGSI